MDLSFSEDQLELRALARRIFTGLVTADRLKEIEAEPDRIDRALWAELARGGFLELEDFVDVCILLEEQGRAVAPVPVWPTLVAKQVLRERDVPSDAIVVVALPADGEDRAALVPAAHVAHSIVAPRGEGLVLVDPSSVRIERAVATTGEPIGRMLPEDIDGERLGRDAEWLLDRATVALCALQVGVAERQLELTAEYLSGREQFERPLGSFQAVQQRIADAYIDVQAMRWTMWQAAYLLSEDLPASEEVAIAKFWAADAGARVSAAAQHLHGAIGVDVEYPLYRYTLWSKHLELLLGSGSRQLVKLGAALAAGGGPK